MRGDGRDKAFSGRTGGSGIQNNKNGTGPLREQSHDISFQHAKISNPHFVHACEYEHAAHMCSSCVHTNINPHSLHALLYFHGFSARLYVCVCVCNARAGKNS